MPVDRRKSQGLLENLRHTLRSLGSRNYALFFFGQGVSLVGTWVQSVAMGVLVWKLTGSKVLLGTVGFAQQIFGFVLSPLAGVLSDRLNRHRLIIATQILLMVQAGVLAVLTLTGTVQLPHIIALAAFAGLVVAFDIPARQAFVVEMVERREDLPNAIALNSFVFNGARLIGPLIAALIIPVFDRLSSLPYSGEGACFAINSVSFLSVVAALGMMRLKQPDRPAVERNVWHNLKEGFNYCLRFAPVRSVLLALGVVSLVSMPYNVLIPAVADNVFHHGDLTSVIRLIAWDGGEISLHYENTVGLLYSSVGLGALLGALFLASRRSVWGLGRLIPIAQAILGLGMVGFALAKTVIVSIPLLVVLGFGIMVMMASCNTIIQTVVDDGKRGRVMSFYTMAFLGTAPFGSLLAGFLANQYGSQATIGGAGVLCVLAAAVFATRLPKFHRMVHPVFVKMGLLSETGQVPKAAAEEDIERQNGNPTASDRSRT